MFGCIAFPQDALHIQLQKQIANVAYKILTTNPIPATPNMQHKMCNILSKNSTLC